MTDPARCPTCQSRGQNHHPVGEQISPTKGYSVYVDPTEIKGKATICYDPWHDPPRSDLALGREELERLELKIELQEAISLVEFMHGCLTDPIFEYTYPEMTRADVSRWRELTKDAPRCTAQRSSRHPPGPCPYHDTVALIARAKEAAA